MDHGNFHQKTAQEELNNVLDKNEYHKNSDNVTKLHFVVILSCKVPFLPIFPVTLLEVMGRDYRKLDRDAGIKGARGMGKEIQLCSCICLWDASVWARSVK